MAICDLRYAGMAGRVAALCLAVMSAVFLITPSALAQAGQAAAIDLAAKEEVADLHDRLTFVQGEIVEADDGMYANPPLAQALTLAGTSAEITVEKLFDKSDPETADLTDSNYIYGPIWARAVMTNSGDETKSWRVDFRAVDTYPLKAWLVAQDGAQTLILSNDWEVDKPRARFPDTFTVASKAFVVPPGETAEIWFDVPHGWSAASYMRLVDEDRIIADRQRDIVVRALLDGMRIAILLGLLAFALVLRDTTAFFYCGFHAGLLLGAIAGEAVAWPSVGFTLAGTAAVSRVLFGIALLCYGFTLRYFLDAPRRYPGFDRVLKFSLLLGLLSIPLLSVLDVSPTLGFYVGLLEAAVWLQFALVAGFGVLRGTRDRLPGAGLFFFATITLVGLGIVQLLFAWEIVLIPLWQRNEWQSLVFVIDALIFAGALVQRARELRRQRDLAQQDTMEALAEKANLKQELDAAQEDYQSAFALAEQRRRDLAATSHDLKQPLLSLQLALGKLKGTEGASEGVTYIENILSRSLDDTRPNPVREGEAQDGFLLDNALRNVTLMFRDEAAEKGIRLSYITTSAAVVAEPIALMRIITNLVANAINHSGAGRILVGARRVGKGVDIVVVDNGRGIPEDKLETVFDAYAAGDGSPGAGLGLTVVRDMAERCGWRIGVVSTPGQGTTFRLGTLEVA